MLVLLGQLAPVPGNVEANVAAIVRTVRAHRDADLAVFPELFLSGYRASPALDTADAALEAIRRAAEEVKTAVIFGFAERCGDGIANAVGAIDGDGRWQGSYRKTHLFGDFERRAFVAGDTLRLFELRGERVGPLICFDMEFPEPARALARAGATLLVTCAANMEPYGPDHALASRARALDNRLPHVYVNRVGDEAERRFVGSSAVIDRDGSVVASLGTAAETPCVELPQTTALDKDIDYLALLRADLEVLDAEPTFAQGGDR
jgi:predicted amidohydrolase